ncbi:STAS domain-containing protein [Amycolatopsis sp. WQ 127309]|uniref:STAS domain-containing protein n=1 Tax=Amycolatopsis sp. WQ 127309 TaxID=2932773 RepID=UPI001FF0F1CE|nr:STAS domain-containing protein [Amycolatopsis sp. WQ 127309]UOZ03340.1 STAS domain-containing protein [Amycolatopsis sp. WQ 127309]
MNDHARSAPRQYLRGRTRSFTNVVVPGRSTRTFGRPVKAVLVAADIQNPREGGIRMTEHSNTHIVTHTHPDLTVVTVTGVLDLFTVPHLEVELSTAAFGLPLIVDLREVSFCCAECIGLLEVTYEHRAGLGDPLSRNGVAVLTGQRAVLRPLQLLGVDRKLIVATTMERARAWLGLPEQPAMAAEPQ